MLKRLIFCLWILLPFSLFAQNEEESSTAHDSLSTEKHQGAFMKAIKKFLNFNIDFILRAGVVYNNSKYFVGTSFLGRTYDYYRDNFSLNNGFGTLQIYAGFNFYLKKEHRKKK